MARNQIAKENKLEIVIKAQNGQESKSKQSIDFSHKTEKKVFGFYRNAHKIFGF